MCSKKGKKIVLNEWKKTTISSNKYGKGRFSNKLNHKRHTLPVSPKWLNNFQCVCWCASVFADHNWHVGELCAVALPGVIYKKIWAKMRQVGTYLKEKIKHPMSTQGWKKGLNFKMEFLLLQSKNWIGYKSLVPRVEMGRERNETLGRRAGLLCAWGVVMHHDLGS